MKIARQELVAAAAALSRAVSRRAGREVTFAPEDLLRNSARRREALNALQVERAAQELHRETKRQKNVRWQQNREVRRQQNRLRLASR